MANPSILVPVAAMHGKVCIVTGATAGMGEVTARALAQMGATTVLVGRDAEKGEAVVRTIQLSTANPNVVFMQVDLSSHKEIRCLASQFESLYPQLDVLVNNVGAVFAKHRLSPDGIEMTFALNHLAPFLLTNLLLERLKATAPARVVNVSSATHHNVRPDSIEDWQSQQRYSMTQAYHRSKLANLLFTYELHRRLLGTGVTVNAVKPGFTNTNLGRKDGGLIGLSIRLVSAVVAQSAQKGAETAIYLATSPDVLHVSGKYFDRQAAIASSKASYDRGVAERLWRLSEELTDLV